MLYSYDCLKDITIRILNGSGKTVGAGFLVDEAQAVTCAHVIHDARSERGGEVLVEFFNSRRQFASQVSADHWSGPQEDDVAILTLPEKHDPKLIPPLQMSTSTLGHQFYALGFPDILGDRGAHPARGTLAHVVPIDANRKPVLLMDGKDVYEGMSGAAVFDLDAGIILGMVSEYLSPEAGTKYAYATTMETIRLIYPYIQQTTSDTPNLSMYAGRLTEKLEMVMEVYKNWGYDTQSMMLVDQLGKQTQTTLEAIHAELQKFPSYRSRLSIEGLLQKIGEDFPKLKGALFLTVLNSTNEERVETEIQKNLTAYSGSIQRLVELIR